MTPHGGKPSSRPEFIAPAIHLVEPMPKLRLPNQPFKPALHAGFPARTNDYRTRKELKDV